MKAIVQNSGKIVDVEVCYAKDDTIFYRDYDNKTDYSPSELEFYLFDEPEEEVTIDGFVDRDTDGWSRLYLDYKDYLLLPRECNIKGDVTITIKPKKI